MTLSRTAAHADLFPNRCQLSIYLHSEECRQFDLQLVGIFEQNWSECCRILTKPHIYQQTLRARAARLRKVAPFHRMVKIRRPCKVVT